MKYESDILEMIHEMKIKEFQLGLISEAKMREYDELCLAPETSNYNNTHETNNIEHADLVTA
jgi:DNA-binding transcriptional regulator YiaG